MKTIILVAVALIGCALAQQQWPPRPQWQNGPPPNHGRSPIVGAPFPPPFLRLPAPFAPDLGVILLTRIMEILADIRNHQCGNNNGSGPVAPGGGGVGIGGGGVGGGGPGPVLPGGGGGVGVGGPGPVLPGGGGVGVGSTVPAVPESPAQ